MKELKKRILDISYKKKLSHIGSCLNAVGVIESMYSSKKPEDKFVLSYGHAFLALAVVLEKHLGLDAEKLVEEHGTHPNRNVDEDIWVSTGSLGQGLPIAVGMAMADKTKEIYVVCSDGEMAEGSMWEALRIAGEQRLENLNIAVVANGYSAYGKVDVDWLDDRINSFYPSLVVRTNLFEYPDWLQGIKGHYVVMNEDQYKEVTK